MNRKGLIDIIAGDFPSRKDADTAVRKVFETIINRIGEGESVVISNFGTFSPRFKDARQRRNPKTGEKVSLPPETGIKFKPSKRMFK